MIKHDLDQLERDAKKEGAWQAKLANAKYILANKATNCEEDKAKQKTNEHRAKGYLRAIIKANIAEYSLEAKWLGQKFFKSSNELIQNALSNTLNIEKYKKREQLGIHVAFATDSQSPEERYKIERINFDYDLVSNEVAATRLHQLLSHQETTDTLRAKIYFQLIQINILNASKFGHRPSLEKAQEYCLLLIHDPHLKDMDKSQSAKRIYKELQNITEKPIYDFSTHMVKSFCQGTEVSRMTFKFLGLIFGNILDLSCLGISKIVTDVTPTFINSGWGWAFASLGNWLGKWVIGIVSGPIAGLIALTAYPLIYAYNKYKANDNVKDLARTIIYMYKTNSDKTKNALSTQNNEENQTIFSHKKVDHQYGNIKNNENNSGGFDTKKVVTPTFFSREHPYAYGRILEADEVAAPTTCFK